MVDTLTTVREMFVSIRIFVIHPGTILKI